MGSGSSAEKKIENVQKKISVVAKLGGATRTEATQNNGASRSDVYDFVKARKAEKEEDWSELGGAKRKSSNVPRKMDQMYEYTGEAEVDNVCPLCRKPTMVGVNGCLCRVCAKMYHKPCLQKSGRFTDAEMKFVDRAGTTIGWSCHECDNICNLLNPDEMGRLSDEFESFDIDKDSSVTEKEFLAFRKERYEKEEGTTMPEFEYNFEKIQFRSLDADRSGSIDYWEFMKHQAGRKLAIKDKEDLVKALTISEKKAARRFYETFDTDGDGIIYELEAKMALRSFYGCLDKRLGSGSKTDGDGTIKPHRESSLVENQASLKTGLLMDGDDNDDKILTWEEFLRNQAIYIISSRPNKTNIGA